MSVLIALDVERPDVDIGSRKKEAVRVSGNISVGSSTKANEVMVLLTIQVAQKLAFLESASP
jgi:hypothetical protein